MKKMTFGVTPSQTIGPFFHYGMDWEGGANLVGENVVGERIGIEGRVFDGSGTAVTDALIEIWQANASGRYTHPEDSQQTPPDEDEFIGFGRTETDDEGYFRFDTIKPGRVPGPENTLQAPHISVSVFARGVLDRLATRLYFSDETEANAEDAVLSAIEDETVRASLLAKLTESDGKLVYRFNIHLQGEQETLFFEI